MEFDVAVLGGGPAGYTAAIRAAQLGARVACVERETELGGTCLRVGCIPTKAWVSTAHALHAAREINPKLGVTAADPQLDFAKANEWKAQVVKQMTGGVASLFKANNVTWLEGSARFEGARSLVFDKGDLGLSFTNAIIATGSYPVTPPIPGLDSPRCVDSSIAWARWDFRATPRARTSFSSTRRWRVYRRATCRSRSWSGRWRRTSGTGRSELQIADWRLKGANLQSSICNLQLVSYQRVYPPSMTSAAPVM